MRRYWISFEESWIKAFLVDVNEETIEEVEAKAKRYGTIYKIQNTEMETPIWRYTNTIQKDYSNL